jgi:hypothetical protein
MKKITALILILAASASAGPGLTPRDMERLKEAKAILADAEPRPLDAVADQLTKTGSPYENLQIYEVVALTFQDIIREHGAEVKGRDGRQRLLEKVKMNLAYFQLGGPDVEAEGEDGLNILIRRKLKDHMPKELWGNPKLFHSLD